ncbi:MAG: hypothetical protein ACRDA8_17875 [Shewanella sp.]
MEGTSKFAIRMTLELATMKLDALDRESRLIGNLARSKDEEARKTLVELSMTLDIELGAIREIISNALLVSKDFEPEV